jgi:hypothetical protein
MRVHPIIQLAATGAALWALAPRLLSRTVWSRSRAQHAAVDPIDPAAGRLVGPAGVRDAGPAAMRGNDPEWDKVDQAGDESFPASDPPSR